MYYPKSHKELPKPNDFLCYFKSYYVSDFYNGVSNARLLHISLNNNHTTKSKYKIGGRPMRILIRLKV